uniref:Uncharacterized protein n=1 Tax=Onchocerca volvulus TaxID=6282 RepID=A0A8R1TVI9_ONCVO
MEKLNIQQARRNNYEIANVTIFNDPRCFLYHIGHKEIFSLSLFLQTSGDHFVNVINSFRIEAYMQKLYENCDACSTLKTNLFCELFYRKFARAVQRVIIVDKCRLRSKQRNVLDIGNFRNGFSNKEQEDGII